MDCTELVLEYIMKMEVSELQTFWEIQKMLALWNLFMSAFWSTGFEYKMERTGISYPVDQHEAYIHQHYFTY